jgi:hypothetical protein
VGDLGQLGRARPDADVAPGHVRVPRDHGQEVVEVVRDAAGELADRLHLLGLPQPLLELAPLGDVAQHEQVPAGQELGRRPDLEHQAGTVLLAVPDVLDHPLSDPLGLQEALPIGLGAVGSDEVVQPRAHQLVARAAVERARRIVDEHEAARGVEHRDDVHRRVEKRLQLGCGTFRSAHGSPTRRARRSRRRKARTSG